MLTAEPLEVFDRRAAALKRRVLAAARSHPAPVRNDRRPLAALFALLAAAAMLAMYFVWGGPANAAGRPAPVVAWLAVGTVAVAVAASWFALPAPGSMLPRGGRVLVAVALGVPILIGAWIVLWHSVYTDPFQRFGWRCFGLTAATAPWPFAVLVWLSRRFDPVSPQLTGAALGAAAGAWAAVVVELWCPLSVSDHVLVGHVSPLLLLVGLGGALGQRLFQLHR